MSCVKFSVRGPGLIRLLTVGDQHVSIQMDGVSWGHDPSSLLLILDIQLFERQQGLIKSKNHDPLLRKDHKNWHLNISEYII